MADRIVVGVRREGEGPRALIFVETPVRDLWAGDLAIMEDEVGETPARVIVAPGQIVEHALLGIGRPATLRPHDQTGPGTPASAGSALLGSLGLPDSAIGLAGRSGNVTSREHERGHDKRQGQGTGAYGGDP
jgi:hypothetical protein